MKLTEAEAVDWELIRLGARLGAEQAFLAETTAEKFAEYRGMSTLEALATVRRWWIDLSLLEQPFSIRGGAAV